jgi:hypothetical protein
MLRPFYPIYKFPVRILKESSYIRGSDEKLPSLVFIKLWSTDHRWPAAVSQENALKISTENFALDTKRMRNTPIHVCVKTAFVG